MSPRVSTRSTGRNERTEPRRRCQTSRISDSPARFSSISQRDDRLPPAGSLRLSPRVRRSRIVLSVDWLPLAFGGMSDPMQTAIALRAAAHTNAGLQRDVNEDRIHLDLARGLLLVLDRVRGH